MTKITRRQALAFTGSAAGLAACSTQEAADVKFADARPAFSGAVSFRHGVASGDPLPNSVILWTRVTPEDETTTERIAVKYTVFKPGDESAIAASGIAETSASRDFTVKVDAGGLEPDTVYAYAFSVVTENGVIDSPTGRTKTTAASGDAPVKFGVISCSNWQFGYFNVYDALSKMDDLDAIIHLGDYFYEYGIDGYGAEAGAVLGRQHNPVTETVTLGDYRMRHAQYKTDAKLQAAHAAAPWLCTWDDHESTNNSYRTGAENHNPEENEGDWTDRKQAAVQAYLEWMPVRDPEPGRAKESIYRKFEFGDVATVFCLESRLTGRSDEISWFTEVGGLEPAQIPMAAAKTMVRVQDESRTMLGATQEDWLAKGLKASTGAGKAWQVLANQVVMARVRPPNLRQTLSQEQIEAQTVGYIKLLIDFSQLGLPWNLDAWDGFPAARDRLYASAADAKARLITLTGDTHTAWANTLQDSAGEQRGVEFGCTAVTSPGFGTYLNDIPDAGDMFEAVNPEVDHYDPYGRGATIVTLTADSVRADFYKVSTVEEEAYDWTLADSFEAKRDGAGMTGLGRV